MATLAATLAFCHHTVLGFRYWILVKEVQKKEAWRTGLLDILMREQADLEREAKDTRRANAMLASLCYP